MNTIEKIQYKIKEYKERFSPDIREERFIMQGLTLAESIIDCCTMHENTNDWISANNPPETGTEVLVELECIYDSCCTFYSIARYIRFDDEECHWCDRKYGWLEWEKYSDGNGGSQFYKVVGWMPLPKLTKNQT